MTKHDDKLISELSDNLIEVLDQAVGWLDDSWGHPPDNLEWYINAKAVLAKVEQRNARKT
jgi:hypothetical protein